MKCLLTPGGWPRDCRTKGTASHAVENLALCDMYGLQAVHIWCVINPALAAEVRFTKPTRRLRESRSTIQRDDNRNPRRRRFLHFQLTTKTSS
jgi:hypothetical protein